VLRKAHLIAAFVHDTWKVAVDHSKARIPPNEHGFLAARWLEQRVEDEGLVSLVELHDDGYRAWRDDQMGREDRPTARIQEVVHRFGVDLTPFVAFCWADNRTGTKTSEQVNWLVGRLRETGADSER
jgi:hypothetical protein